MDHTSWSITLTNYDKRLANNGRERNPKMAGLDLEELKRYFLKGGGHRFLSIS
jgi:hypothetical protein